MLSQIFLATLQFTSDPIKRRHEDQILYDIFAPDGPNEYHNSILYPEGHGEHIFLLMHIGHVSWYDEKERQIKVYGCMRFIWEDNRVFWYSEDYGGVRKFTRDLSDMSYKPRMPRFGFGEEIYHNSTRILATIVTVYVGSLEALIEFETITRCGNLVGTYPYDRINCSLTLPLSTGKRMAGFDEHRVGEFVVSDDYKDEGATIAFLSEEDGLKQAEFYFPLKRKIYHYDWLMAWPVLCLHFLIQISIFTDFPRPVFFLFCILFAEFLTFRRIFSLIPTVDYENFPPIASASIAILSETLVHITWKVIYLAMSRDKTKKESFRWMQRFEYYYRWSSPLRLLWIYYFVFDIPQ